MDACAIGYLKAAPYGKVCKTCPQKLTFTANFTQKHRHFDIMPERDSMRQDILNSVIRRTESIMLEHQDSDGANPLYEDPRDVIGNKPPKPPRKRNIQGLAVTTPRSTKEGRSQLKEQKRKLTKKYEGLITALMDKCEEQVVLISEKECHISKLKEKLKTVLEYNRLFADENDRLRSEHATLVAYTDDCKRALKEQQDIGVEAEKKCKRLEEKIKQYEMPDREPPEPASLTAIPLVEVCMSCSSRQILLQQARDHAARLQRDMAGLKDVLYRLNVQLARYQEKIRSTVPNLVTDVRGEAREPADKYDGLDSLITASLGRKQDVPRGEEGPAGGAGGGARVQESPAARSVDLSGLLSAQALAPLFDAYQENLQEKDSLILDYERQFESMNRRSRQIVADNKSLSDRVGVLEEELARARQTYKRLALEKETADIEKVTLAERAEKAEGKLKEVYELYEDKMAAMRRDYETVHREYYAVKSALVAGGGACGGRAVPAHLHEQRLEHCKRLLEELKQQHGAESARLTAQLSAAQDQLAAAREHLATALRNAKLYRKAAVVFRQRARAAGAAAARATRVARAARAAGGRLRATPSSDDQLRRALHALDNIKLEIKAVRHGAAGSLAELERRLRRQAGQLARKDSIITSLMNQVADVEEVRLSQTNVHRLQGIVSDSSERSERSERREAAGTPARRVPSPAAPARLVPAAGGYLQPREARRNTKT